MIRRLWGWVRDWRVRRKERVLRKRKALDALNRATDRYRDDTARITLHDDLTPQDTAQFGQSAPWFLYNDTGAEA